MTVKEFQDLCFVLFVVMSLIKRLLRQSCLGNFDAHKASDLADNQIALCAANDYRSDKGLTSCNTQTIPDHQVQDGCLAPIQLKPSNRSHLTTSYVVEGTTAHALAELCLTNNDHPTKYIGQTLEGHIVDEDMAEHIAALLCLCKVIPQAYIFTNIGFH